MAGGLKKAPGRPLRKNTGRITRIMIIVA